MSVHSFGKAVQQANIWLHDLMIELRTDNAELAYAALRSTIHALRDRLTVEEAAHLSAQMPMIIRGIFFEGWRPAATPSKVRRRSAFLAEIERELRNGVPIDTETMARAVFRVLASHISGGEIEDVCRLLPEDLRSMWPSPRATVPVGALP